MANQDDTRAVIGATVHVALDVVLLDDGSYQVLVQGVFTDPADVPQPRPPAGGAVSRDRNVVGCFLGADMRGVSAFRIFPERAAQDSA